jgi:PAS domain S-box-containing protein
MDKSSFQTLLRRTVAIPVVLLVLLAGTLIVEVLSLTSSLHQVDHSDRVMANARQSMRYMVDMESSVRGLELTGDKSFLETFEQSRKQLPASVDQLVQLTADDALEQSRLKDIRDLDREWIRWAQQEIEKHADKKPTEMELLAGNRLMDQIRARQREVQSEEERLLLMRSHRASILGRIVLGTAVGLSLLTAGLLLTVTRRELRALTTTYEAHLTAEAERTRQLEESREWFQTTLNSLGEAVVATDADGKITYINPIAQQLTGWTGYVACGRPLSEVVKIVDEFTHTELRDPFALGNHPDKAAALSNQVALVDRTGRQFPVEVGASPILGNRRELAGTVVVFRDVTARRQTEQTLRASDRLTQAGRLAATIAHEIRNPLDTVSNLIFLLRHQSHRNPETTHYLELAGEELARITQITGQLLTFHREAQSPVDVDLTTVLKSALALYSPQINMAGVTVESRFETHRPVRGFPGELRQVFANLVANAIHSMPSGGELLVHVFESSLASDHARKGIRVTVLDNGMGIPPGVRKNLFAPFYTTKGEGGTGLGLWVTRGIIEKHEGTIHFISSVRPGRSGTAFSVFLPFEQLLGKLDLAKSSPLSEASRAQ